MVGYVDPRELTAGYSHSQGKGVAAYWGVLRDGSAEVWRCAGTASHRPHMAPIMARHSRRPSWSGGCRALVCAGRAALRAVLAVLGSRAGVRRIGRGRDCGRLRLRGLCPRCTGPAARVRMAVLEREGRRVRSWRESTRRRRGSPAPDPDRDRADADPVRRHRVRLRLVRWPAWPRSCSSSAAAGCGARSPRRTGWRSGSRMTAGATAGPRRPCGTPTTGKCAGCGGSWRWWEGQGGGGRDRHREPGGGVP